MTALSSEGLEKALPCVFCQGEIFLGEVQRPDGIGGWKKSGYRASCRSCEMSMKEANSEAEAVAAWNLRALLPVDGLEVVAEVEGLLDAYWGLAFMEGREGRDTDTPEDAAQKTRSAISSRLVTLSQASSVIAGLERHNQALLDKVSSEDCACAYDGPDDVCLGHSPKLKAAEARISSLEEENKRLREVVSASAAALSNGAFILPEASLEFMEMLPLEIGKFCDRLERDKTRLQRKIDLLETTVSFTRRWAIEKEGNGTSAEERLSAIANHPGIIGLNLEDHND